MLWSVPAYSVKIFSNKLHFYQYRLLLRLSDLYDILNVIWFCRLVVVLPLLTLIPVCFNTLDFVYHCSSLICSSLLYYVHLWLFYDELPMELIYILSDSYPDKWLTSVRNAHLVVVVNTVLGRCWFLVVAIRGMV